MDRVYPSAKRQRLDTQPEEDSDYCIIVEPTGPNSTAKKNVLNRVAEFEDDEIVFIGETGGQCYCYVCDVPASQCTFWGTGSRRRDHCNASSSDSYWTALRKEARKGNKALLSQEHSSTDTHLTTHWLNSKKRSAQSRPRTLDQFWARVGVTRVPRGGAPAAAGAAQKSSCSDSSTQEITLDSAASQQAAAAVEAAGTVSQQTAEPGFAFLRPKIEKLDEPESPVAPRSSAAVQGSAADAQQQQHWQQDTALEDITNLHDVAFPAAAAAAGAAKPSPPGATAKLSDPAASDDINAAHIIDQRAASGGQTRHAAVRSDAAVQPPTAALAPPAAAEAAKSVQSPAAAAAVVVEAAAAELPPQPAKKETPAHTKPAAAAPAAVATPPQLATKEMPAHAKPAAAAVIHRARRASGHCKTPKCGSCVMCLNPQRKQACVTNRERLAKGLPPILPSTGSR